MSQISPAEAVARTEFGLWDVPDSRYPVFLIDTSGSMAEPDKLPLLVNSFNADDELQTQIYDN